MLSDEYGQVELDFKGYCALYREAMRDGRLKDASEFKDRIYESGFELNQVLGKVIKLARDSANQTRDTERKQNLLRQAEEFSELSRGLVQELNKLVLKESGNILKGPLFWIVNYGK